MNHEPPFTIVSLLDDLINRSLVSTEKLPKVFLATQDTRKRMWDEGQQKIKIIGISIREFSHFKAIPIITLPGTGIRIAAIT